MATSAETTDRQAVLIRALLDIKELRAKLDAVERARSEPIAIVGMSCRFPGGANSLDEYWAMLRDGREGIGEVPPDRWDVNHFYDPDPDTPGKMYTRYGGFMRDLDVSKFDAQFFNISPREAAGMDPQHRLLLEVSWEALEHAGIAPDRLSGSRSGVFVGIIGSEYTSLQLGMGVDIENVDVYSVTGNVMSIAAGRISYVLGLQGPSVALDTACSSSLVAAHLAVQSLRSGECNMALVAGVSVLLSPMGNVGLSKMRALAVDGRCKSFDASADGYGRSEGVGVLVLKRLSDAQRDGDPIHALIRGSAVNQDGPSSGLTVPNGPAQQAVIRQALQNAGIEPHQVGYLEAHGTGTPLGDPIEIQALTAALGKGRTPEHALAIGSAKANIGHLEAAAGVAGLIKVALGLRHRELPPHPTLRSLNPRIALDPIPATIPTTLQPWQPIDGRRIAGISSFGFSGTNAHLVLEEPPAPPTRQAASPRSAELLVLSARQEAALPELARRYAAHLAAQPTQPLADICASAATGRAHLSQRLAVVASDTSELRDLLERYAAGQTDEALLRGEAQAANPPKIAFLFTGQGSQYRGMGQQLYNSQPTFRAAFDRCAEILLAEAGWDVRQLVFGDQPDGAHTSIDDTQYTQPALFALEYALTELWRSWGVTPDAVIGHSVGEYAAACAAGVFSLEDGLKLIAARGRLMGQLPAGGAMAAIFAPHEQVRQALGPLADQLSIAAINGPTETVVSGAQAAVATLVEQFAAQGVQSRNLVVSHAFHSPLMEPMLEVFGQVASTVSYRTPKLRVVSNVSGKLLKDATLSTPDYWREHVRAPVLFAEGIAALISQGYTTFVEIGPKPTLLGMARKGLAEEFGSWLPSLRAGQDEWRQILAALGSLYIQGVAIDWAALTRDQAPQRVVLPHYPWQGQRHWFELPKKKRPSGGLPVTQPLLGARLLTPLPTFERQLDLASLPLLEEYRLHGLHLLPPALYLELALEAAQEVFGPGAHQLAGLTIHDVLLAPNSDGPVVQVVLTPQGSDTAQFQLWSQAADQSGSPQAWQLHASGQLRIATAATPLALAAPSEVQARCGTPISGNDYSARLRERGLERGGRFQSVTQLWSSTGEALARLEATQAASIDAGRFLLHPAILEECLGLLDLVLPNEQSVAYNAPELLQQALRGMAFARLTNALERFQIYDHSARPAWSYLRLRDADAALADLQILDAGGQVIAEACGLRTTTMTRERLRRALPHQIADWLYEPAWLAQPRATPAAAPTAGERWLIFADQGGLGAALADRLAAHDIEAQLVYRDATSLDQLAGLVGATLDDTARPCRRIAYLWLLDSPVTAALNSTLLEETQLRDIGDLLALVRALAGREASARLWVVTRGAQPVGAPAPLALAQSAAWGLGRVIALEHADLWGGMLDLDPASGEGDLDRLLEELTAPEQQDHLAFRLGQRYSLRLLQRPDLANSTSLPRLTADATYLITGGLGGLGMELAGWMVERGARHLVLTGRRALPARAEWPGLPQSSPHRAVTEAITALEARGATVLIAQADITSSTQMTALFEQLRTGAQPLRGILHAAGLTQPQLIQELAPETLRAVLLPKLTGTWLLHQLSQECELDFFVLFSSITSVWGSVGLANYAAANHFLDAFAHHRRALGLPALSINWGPWAEVGMTATVEEQALLSRIGVEALPTRDALAALERLLADGPPQATVAAVDWNLFKPIYEVRGYRPLLDRIAGPAQASPEHTAERQALLTTIQQADLEERAQLLTAYLQERLARAMRLTIDQISVDSHIMQLGLDSLMVMELLNDCKRDLQLMLYAREFFEHPSLAALGRYLAGQFDRRDDAAPPSAAPLSLLGEAPRRERQQIDPAERNRGIAFLLSSPRSGSTLLRVMLEGHSGLFCPPELHLLPFDTMAERNATMGISFMGEGLERALMELRGSDADDVKALVASLNQSDTSIHQVYRLLQEQAGARLLVDKSPSYAASLDTLLRAEELFDRPKYIHLVRHPYAVIESFVRTRIDRLFTSGEVDPSVMAEQVWATTNRNVLEFLAQVDPDRHYLVRYEDLVADPEQVMRGLCAFLGVPFDPAVLNPYEGNRMTDGVRSKSLSIGDPNFLNHDRIDPALGQVWRSIQLPRLLASDSLDVALQLHYELPAEQAAGLLPATSALAAAALVYAGQLAGAHTFLAAAGIDAATAQRFGLGYAPATPDALSQALAAQGYPADSLVAAGLREGEADRFSHRLIIPLYDLEGRVAGLLARDLDGLRDDLYALAEPAVRDRLVFGLPQARAAIALEDQAIVLEDYLDVLRAHSAGFGHMVGSLGHGATLTAEQFGQLLPISEMIVGATLRGELPKAVASSPPPAFQGRFELRSFTSRELGGRAVDYSLLVPAHTNGGQLPLLLFLQGAERADPTQLNGLLDRLMAQGALTPMLVVTLGSDRSLYLNRRDGSANWESFLLDEFLPTLEQQLGPLLDRQRVGLVGGSMGGLGALRMAFKRPERFAAVAAHAPAIEPALTYAEVPHTSVLAFLRPASFLAGLYGTPVDADGYWTANNPAALARQNAARIRASGLRLYLDCGTADSMAFVGTQFLHEVLEQAGIAHTFKPVADGRHNRAFFSIAILQGFQFLSEEFARLAARRP